MALAWFPVHPPILCTESQASVTLISGTLSRAQTLLEKTRRGLAASNTMSCPRGIQSVTQSHVNQSYGVENSKWSALPN